MSEIQTHSANIISTPVKWEKTTFDANDMWNAFQRGEKYQRDKQEDEFNAAFSKNITRPVRLTITLPMRSMPKNSPTKNA